MPKILIVDDNLASRELMRAVLKRLCDEVLEARDGEEALEEIGRTRPDLVLLDIEMPVLDGIAVIHRIRADPRFTSLPVWAVTANAMQGTRERLIGEGFDGYVTKPINAAMLRRQVKELLGS